MCVVKGKRRRRIGDQACSTMVPSRGREEDFSIGALRDFASSHSIFAFADRLARVQVQQASKQLWETPWAGSKKMQYVCVSGIGVRTVVMCRRMKA